MTPRGPEPEQRIIDMLCRGVAPPRRATYLERVAAIRHLTVNGFSGRQVAHLVGVSVRTVRRACARYEIAGQPIGTNGSTRARSWPLPSQPYRKTEG